MDIVRCSTSSKHTPHILVGYLMVMDCNNGIAMLGINANTSFDNAELILDPGNKMLFRYQSYPLKTISTRQEYKPKPTGRLAYCLHCVTERLFLCNVSLHTCCDNKACNLIDSFVILAFDQEYLLKCIKHALLGLMPVLVDTLFISAVTKLKCTIKKSIT